MLPFTVEQFLHVFEQYNQAIWPMHIVAYVLGVATLVLAAVKTRYSSQAISLLLAGFWVWMGVAYHILFFSSINQLAYGFGALFIIQALLWLYAGSIRRDLSFELQANPYALVGALLIMYAMLAYPWLNSLLGHAYPRSPAFGLAPCPTTIFSFGLLLWTDKPVPKWLLIIPFLWSLIGLSAALMLGIGEDLGLVLAGLLSVGLLLWRDRSQLAPNKRQRYA